MSERYERRRTKLYGPEELEPAAREVLERAEDEGHSAAVVGGLAMQFFGSDRLTSDLDVIADDMLRQITPTGRLTFGGMKFKTASGVPVDWIVRGDEYAELYDEALTHAVLVYDLPVVTPEYLAAMKLAAGRPKDQEDLIFLLQQEALVDLAKTRNIIRRFVGGRFAVDDFDSVLSEAKWRLSREAEQEEP